MQEQPLVSIQCLVYNHEPYLRQCLDAFVMQKTNFKFEAIVHDDVSTDGSAAIIREYAEKYPDIIKPIFETENQYSKHDGSLERIMHDACKGKYIALCEGDDYWTDSLKLQKQVDFMEANPQYSFCCHRFKRFFQETKSWDEDYASSLYKNNEAIEITRSVFFAVWVTQPLTVLYRAKSYLKFRNKIPKYKYFRDVHLFYHLLKVGKGMSLNDIMGVYRINSGGVASGQSLLNRYKTGFLVYWDLYKKNILDLMLLRCARGNYLKYIEIKDSSSK